ncbi:MAG: YggS family pyridoxal phosphate-dependent enzyme [Bryobacteraceae bacterium]
MSRNESSFETRLEAVEDRIQRAVERSRRSRSDITLVAVSKKFSAAAIREAYGVGLREFGENYVQEFAEKHPELQDLNDGRFHLIGHLQSNKARVACELFKVIQTADSVKLLRRLDTAAAEAKAQPEVLIEVKLSDEENKSGARPEELPSLMEASATCTHLNVSGLMTMPPWSTDAEQSRPYFQELARLARQYKLPQLSMGMSGDFEVAIEEGATIIRVGTALFGPRPKPSKVPAPLAS